MLRGVSPGGAATRNVALNDPIESHSHQKWKRKYALSARVLAHLCATWRRV